MTVAVFATYQTIRQTRRYIHKGALHNFLLDSHGHPTTMLGVLFSQNQMVI